MYFVNACSRFPAALLVLAGVVGCGGGGGGSGVNLGPPDTTSPSVTGMTPGEDTAGVGTDSTLTATLSEAMIAGEISTDTFRVTDGISAIPGVVSFDAVNHIAVFTPTGDLAPNTRYTATIVTGIGDLAGNPLTTDFAWCFVTGGGADSSTPGITATFPSDAATDVATNQKIGVTFSTDMNSATITPASFVLTGPGGAPVSGAVTYIGRTAIFTPSRNLASHASYTATVTTAVLDLAGTVLPTNVTWMFATRAGADVIAPVVVSFDPASGASGVPISSTINVALSKPMDPATVTTATFTVTGPGDTPVIGIVAFNAASNTATFTRTNHLTTPVAFHPVPTSELEASTIYTAKLTTGAKDMAGNALVSDVMWSFTTAP